MAEELVEGRITNVVERQVGTELSDDVSAGSFDLVVENGYELDGNGGTLVIGDEEIVYTVDSPEDGTVSLATALANDYLATEPVWLSPTTMERIAFVVGTDQQEELPARVPHALYDRIAVGIRNPEAGLSEEVECEPQGGELIVTDLLGQAPVVDGSFLDDYTVAPTAVLDGIAPDHSPTPTVTGAIGAVAIGWSKISNHDPVTYEVHLSDTDGFTPSALTKVTETDGDLVFVRKLTGGGDLDFGTTYYAVIIAKDGDGAAAPGTQASGSIAAIDTGEITSDGDAPSGSPTPTVIGGPTFLAVKWTPVANADPVTYEVHVSTSTGFTPGPTTKYAETSAASIIVKTDAAGGTLAYATTYYVKIVAKDADGSAAASTEDSASMVQISATDVANDTLTASQIAAGAITPSELAALAVTAGKIDTGGVTAGNIAADVVTATEIAAGAIGASEIAAGAVIAGKIAANAVTTTELAANTITASDIAAGTITTAEIAANTITAADIAAGTITATELAANTITAAKIAAGTITATEIAASTITAAKMNVSQLSAIAADLGIVTAGTYKTGTSDPKLQIDTSNSGELFITDASGNHDVSLTGAAGLDFLSDTAGSSPATRQLRWLNPSGGAAQAFLRYYGGTGNRLLRLGNLGTGSGAGNVGALDVSVGASAGYVLANAVDDAGHIVGKTIIDTAGASDFLQKANALSELVNAGISGAFTATALFGGGHGTSGISGGSGAVLGTDTSGHSVHFDWDGTNFILKCYVDTALVTSFKLGSGLTGTSTKTFVIDHPLDKARHLVHACLEGPEAGVYYRGTGRLAAGRATVKLPDYFEELTEPETRTVHVSPVLSRGQRDFTAVAAGEIEANRFRVRGEGSQHFAWTVFAERRDTPVFVEPRKNEVSVRGDGPYTYIA